MSLIKKTVAALVIAAWSWGAYASDPLPKPDGKEAEQKILAAAVEGQFTEGAANAPIELVIYMSTSFPHCADFFLHTFPKLREKYIKTGKVRLSLREFAFEPRGTAGFMLARCLPKERYLPMLELLFAKQNEWAFVQDTITPLKGFAGLAGMDGKAFEACLQNQSVLEKVQESYKKALALGVSGIPTIFINETRYVGEMSFEQFDTLLQAALKPHGE